MTKEGDFTLNDDDSDDEQDTWEGEDAAWTNDLDEAEGEVDGDVKDESAAYLEFLQEEVSSGCSEAMFLTEQYVLGTEVHS